MEEKIELKWDGSDIGVIDKYIIKYTIEKGLVYLYLSNGKKVIVNRFDDTIPLIADELKPIFDLPKIGRHRCKIGERDAIISQVVGEEKVLELTTALSPDVIFNIQKCYIYRWALGLTQNFDSSLLMRTLNGVTTVTSFKEIKVAYELSSSGGSVIPKSKVKLWFSDWDKVNEVTKTLFSTHNVAELRFKIEAVIRRVDPKRVSWIVQILKRIQERCS